MQDFYIQNFTKFFILLFNRKTIIVFFPNKTDVFLVCEVKREGGR